RGEQRKCENEYRMQWGDHQWEATQSLRARRCPALPGPTMGNSQSARTAAVFTGKELRQKLVHDVAFHVRKAEVATLEAVGQLRVVEAEEVQDGGVQIMHVHR